MLDEIGYLKDPPSARKKIGVDIKIGAFTKSGQQYELEQADLLMREESKSSSTRSKIRRCSAATSSRTVVAVRGST